VKHSVGNEFGSKFATCLGCGRLYEKAELRKNICKSCQVASEDQRKLIMAKVESQALTKLATELTAALKASSKNEAIMPGVMQAALDRLGKHYHTTGQEAFGGLLANQIIKATGEDLTPIEAATWKYSPLVVHRFMELFARIGAKNDERQSLDVSSLSEDDLIGSLTTLVLDMIETNEEYRRMAVMAGIKKQPDLIHEAMTIAGVPVLSGQATPIPIEADFDDDNEYAQEAIDDDDGD